MDFVWELCPGVPWWLQALPWEGHAVVVVEVVEVVEVAEEQGGGGEEV
jgi:hypothetical protein